MKNEEIVKQLKYISTTLWRNGCGGLGALDELIDTLSPKPLFKVGPAKTTGDNLVVIHEIHEGFIFGRIMSIPPDKWFSHSWLDSGEDRFGCSSYNLLPNNNEPEEKVYGPQKCNDTVKLCMNCEHENSPVCFSCHGRDKWTPVPTTKELWKRVLAVEKAHKDAGNSKLKNEWEESKQPDYKK